MTAGQVKDLKQMVIEGEAADFQGWQGKAVIHEDCLSYIVWNAPALEYLVVDPRRDDLNLIRSLAGELSGYRCLGVVDTHTHADHISGAAELAEKIQAPLFMHVKSPSKRVHCRVALSTHLSTRAGLLRFMPTPGHTEDGLCVLWGPLVFTGDTVLFGDVGRDDLPGGDPAAHFDSLGELKAVLAPSQLILPGHDNKGGRVSTWKTQLEKNSSLTQGREEFIQECQAFDAPAPQLFKRSLAENFK